MLPLLPLALLSLMCWQSSTFIDTACAQSTSTNTSSGNNQTTTPVSSLSQACEATTKTVTETECNLLLRNPSSSPDPNTVCKAPADGQPGHFCTDAQINKALDSLERDCKQELAQGDKAVRFAYYALYVSPIVNQAMCIKASNGSYCTGMVSGDNDCSQCARDQLKLIKNWKPSRPSAIPDAMKELSGGVENAANKCGAGWLDAESSTTRTWADAGLTLTGVLVLLAWNWLTATGL